MGRRLEDYCSVYQENKLLHTVKTFRKLRDTRHGLLELLRKETGRPVLLTNQELLRCQQRRRRENCGRLMERRWWRMNGDSKVEAESLSVLFNFTATMRAIILICHLKSNLLFLLLFYLWQPVIMKHCVYLLYFVLWYHIKKNIVFQQNYSLDLKLVSM